MSAELDLECVVPLDGDVPPWAATREVYEALSLAGSSDIVVVRRDDREGAVVRVIPIERFPARTRAHFAPEEPERRRLAAIDGDGTVRFINARRVYVGECASA
jgi:hypothetical protein